MLIFVKKHKDLYFVPNFLVSFGILFAAFVGMFSRLIPKFWKMFLDLGVIAIWALAVLGGGISIDRSCAKVGEAASACIDYSIVVKHSILDVSQFEDWWLVGLVAIVNMVFLVFRGEYTASSLKGEKFLRFLIPLNLLTVGGYAAFRCFTQTTVINDEIRFLPYDSKWVLVAIVSSLFIPLALFAWRRIAFWINYFYRIFAKKRHRSILLGGGEDSLQPWFDSHIVIPGMEILGCVSRDPCSVSEENRKHLLGSYVDMDSICRRTDCHELLVVSNFSGSRENFDLQWLEKLGMKVFLLIGTPRNGDFALINLKNLH
jgi:hypothetical protein